MLTKSAWVTGIGTTVEWFEFAVFVYLSPIISSVFFPNTEPKLALMQTYALIGIGFISRPLGAVFYGWIGDRYGRKRALVTSSALIAVALLITASLPTYAQVGVWAPILLLASRLLQGFSAGGEGTGTYVSLTEQGRDQQRAGYFFGFGYMLSSMGFGLAFIIVTLCQNLLGSDVMNDWGWRVPFIIGAISGLGFWLLRQGIVEGSEYQQATQQSTTPSNPLTGLRGYLPALFAIFIINGVGGALFYLTAIAFVEGVPWYFGVITTLVLPVFCLVGGALRDKSWGRGVFLTLTILTCLTSPLLFWLGETYHWYGLYLVVTSLFLVIGNYAMATTVRLVPAQMRYTGFALAFNLSAVLGGFTPALYQWLQQVEGSELSAFTSLSLVSMLILLAYSFWPRLKGSINH